MYKNPVGSRFIITSAKYTLKPLSKDITAIFKLLYKKLKSTIQKIELGLEIKRFWAIQNNKSVIDFLLNAPKYPMISFLQQIKLNHW